MLRTHISRFLMVVAMVYVQLAWNAAVHGQGRHQVLVKTGDSLPGGAGPVTDLSIEGATLDGLIGFQEQFSLSPVDEAFYLADGTTISKLARSGDFVPGLGQIDFMGIGSVSQSGAIGFFAHLTGVGVGSSNDTGVYSATGGGFPTQIVREGNATSNGVFDNFSNGARPVIDANGRVYFAGLLTGTSGGSNDNVGIFAGDGSVIDELVRKGDSAGNGTFNIFNPHVVNDQNQIAFSASLNGTSGGATDDRALFRTDGHHLLEIARKGQSTPDGNGTYQGFSTGYRINQLGQVAFIDTSISGTTGIPGDTSGIFRGDEHSLIQIARGGMAAPDGDGTIGFFANGVISGFNDNGQVLYHAIMIGSSLGTTNDEGFYLSDGVATKTIVREGLGQRKRFHLEPAKRRRQ